MQLTLDEIESPVGIITLVATAGAVVSLRFGAHDPGLRAQLEARHGAVSLRSGGGPRDFSSRVRAYLSGDLGALDGVPIEPGGTAFQRRVWEAVRAIRPGATRSYGALAVELGKPLAARAVGLANARNPVGLIIPCHRVIGSTGALTGYAYGIERKRWLLTHEGSA